MGARRNGRAESGLLPLGDYYVVEMSAPAGFELDASRHYATLEGGGDVEVTIQATDTPTPPDWGGVVVFFRHVWDTSVSLMWYFQCAMKMAME